MAEPVSGARRVLEWFDSGQLMRPGGEEPGFVDLVRALGSWGGADGLDSGDHVRRLRDLIGPAERVVFVLVDGMGSRILEKAPAGGLLRSHTVADLKAVFPPTTAAALTTLATARWPGEHAVVCWWHHLPRLGLSVTTLPFTERWSGRSLAGSGVRPEDVYPMPSFWGRMTRSTLTVLPKQITDSVFSRYAVAETERTGYTGLGEAFDVVATRMASGDGPRFVYLYLPHVDALVHRAGTEDTEVAALLGVLDGQLTRLRAALDDRTRLVVSADHGLVTVPAERQVVLDANDRLMETLLCPPTGEPTVPILHARPGCEVEARRLFTERTGDAFAMLTPDEAEELRLFGPGPLSAEARARLGTYFGVAGEPAAVYTRSPGGTVKKHVGLHAGLSPAEMWIPLIVA